MSQYLLPCDCGRRTVVSTAQAGESIQCGCGARLDVPSMRGLRSLEPADGSRDAKGTDGWSDRHRGAFLLVLAAIAGLVAAGYLAWQLKPPPADERETPEAFESAWKTASPGQVVEVFDELKKGLRLAPADPSEETKRRTLLWGIGIALIGSTLALVAAGLVLKGGRRGKQSIG